MSDKVYLGQLVEEFERSDPPTKVSRVNLVIDSETIITAGDDTGRTIEVTNPWGTQEMANDILARMSAVEYKPFSASNALIDPAAEIGDGITVGGIYTSLDAIDFELDAACVADISAPESDEIDDEYPYSSQNERSIARQIAFTRSLITKTSSEISLKVESLDSDFTELKVTLDGVTVTDSSGTTLIKGSSIETDSLNLTGKITFGDLSSGVQNDINDAWSMAYSAQSLASDVDDVVSAWTYGGTTYIDGNMLMTNTVRASTLEGGLVALLNSSGGAAGTLTMTGASTASYAVALKSYGALRLMADAGAVYAESGYGTYLQLTDTITVGYGDFKPNADGVYSCGSASHKWSEVYADTETITTSDRNRKNSINYDLSAYDAFFDSLKPVSFKFNEGSSGRTHIGMISQDVETSLADCGLTSLDFAGFITFEDEECSERGYALRYGEFIPLCIDQLQRLKARVSELEEKI